MPVCLFQQLRFKLVEFDVVGCLHAEDCTAEDQQLTDNRDCGICNLSKRLDEEQAHHRDQDSACETRYRKTALQTRDFYVGHLWHDYLTIKTFTKLDDASFRKASVQPGLLNFPSATVQHMT